MVGYGRTPLRNLIESPHTFLCGGVFADVCLTDGNFLEAKLVQAAI